MRSSEFDRDIVPYLDDLDNNPRNIQFAEDIIGFTKTFPDENYPAKDVGKFMWTQAEGIDVDSKRYKNMVAQEQFYGGEDDILGAVNEYGIDVLALPASQDLINDLAAKMGFPVISIPLRFWPEGTPLEYKGAKALWLLSHLESRKSFTQRLTSHSELSKDFPSCSFLHPITMAFCYNSHTYSRNYQLFAKMDHRHSRPRRRS